MSSLPPALLRSAGNFAFNPRFALPEPAPDDEVDEAATDYDRGFADGSAMATERAMREEGERAADRGAIELAFARLDAECAAALRERLRQTVLMLCEAAILPLAIDPEGLVTRIDRAVKLLQQAQDRCRVLLNPDDLALVRDRLPDGLRVDGDATIERGSLRAETPDGGVEDGPQQWRRILAEALGEC